MFIPKEESANCMHFSYLDNYYVVVLYLILFHWTDTDGDELWILVTSNH